MTSGQEPRDKSSRVEVVRVSGEVVVRIFGFVQNLFEDMSFALYFNNLGTKPFLI